MIYERKVNLSKGIFTYKYSLNKDSFKVNQYRLAKDAAEILDEKIGTLVLKEKASTMKPLDKIMLNADIFLLFESELNGNIDIRVRDLIKDYSLSDVGLVAKDCIKVLGLTPPYNEIEK